MYIDNPDSPKRTQFLGHAACCKKVGFIMLSLKHFVRGTMSPLAICFSSSGKHVLDYMLLLSLVFFPYLSGGEEDQRLSSRGTVSPFPGFPSGPLPQERPSLGFGAPGPGPRAPGPGRWPSPWPGSRGARCAWCSAAAPTAAAKAPQPWARCCRPWGGERGWRRGRRGGGGKAAGFLV